MYRVGIAHRRSLHCAHEAMNIVDRTPEGPVMRQGVPQPGKYVHRDATERRFEADGSAPSGRNTNRSTHVASFGHRHTARGHGGAGSTTRAARRSQGVPWIASGAPQTIVGDARVGELGCVGAADDDRPGREQPIHDPRVRFGDDVALGPRTESDAVPSPWRGVLDGHRHAMQRTVTLAQSPCPIEGLVGPDLHEAVQLRLNLVDATQGCFDEFERCCVTTGEQPTLVGDGRKCRIHSYQSIRSMFSRGSSRRSGGAPWPDRSRGRL